MKRFSPREFALLCSPLLVVGAVGWLLSKRKPPSPNADKLHLEFRLEKPPMLKAFEGADAALTVELKGPNTQYGPGKDPLRIYRSDPFLEVKTGKEVRKSRSSYARGEWKSVWKSGVNSTYYINTRAIPPGTLRFGVDAVLSPISTLAAKKSPRVSGVWTVDRANIKPFDFQKLARLPLVRLSSARIIQINANGNIRGEAVFDLIGAAMNAQTPFDYAFNNRGRAMSSGYGSSDLTPQTPTTRVREWTILKDFSTVNGAPTPQIVHLSGRVSADERWPLAFEFEPFDYYKVKVGQTLKSKSWPAPTPKP